MKIERNLGFELVRATEAAALRAARWMGRGDKIGADQGAVDATLDSFVSFIPIKATIPAARGSRVLRG